MDRNSLIGFFLIALLMFVWMWYTQPSPEELERQKHIQDSIAAAQVDTSVVVQEKKWEENKPEEEEIAENPDTQALQSKYGIFAPHLIGKDTTITLENELLKIKVSSKGGRIVYAELKKYRTYDSNPLVLIDELNSHFNYNIAYQGNFIKSSDLYFKPQGGSVFVKDGDSAVIDFVVQLDESTALIHEFSLSGNDYMVGFNIKMKGLDKIIPRNITYLDLTWNVETKQLERPQTKQSARITRNFTTIYYRFANESPEFLNDMRESEEQLRGKIQWVAFKQHFFNQTLISEDYFIRGLIKSEPVEDSYSRKKLSAILSFPYKHASENEYRMRFYFGPNHFTTLKKYKLKLERQIFLGRGLLRWINTVLVIPVFNFLNRYISNYGIIILLLTIFIKLLLLPLTYRSYLSTAKMRVLKPELDALKEKVGKDPAKLQTEQMKLYRSAGVNPLGGCLPMLLQMPILIALFRFFPSSIELRQQSFLWAHDLSTYDSIWDFPNGFRIPGYGDHVSLFTLLMTISTIIYTRMNSNMMTGDQAKQMKIIQYIMPIMFLGFFNNYSAGLSYYYFLANIITFGQQYLFKVFIDEDKLRKQIEANKSKSAKKPKSRWQKRLEELQKQQRQVQRKR